MFEQKESPRWLAWFLYGVAVLCLFCLGWMIVEGLKIFFQGK